MPDLTKFSVCIVFEVAAYGEQAQDILQVAMHAAELACNDMAAPQRAISVPAVQVVNKRG